MKKRYALRVTGYELKAAQYLEKIMALKAISICFLICVSIWAEEATDVPALLTERGKLLKQETFDAQTSVEKGNKGGWGIYKGKFEIVDGHMKVTEQKEDGHHPAMSCKLPSKNLSIQCRFKVGDSKWQGLSLDNGKEKVHVFRAMINPNSISIKRMSGMGATTKGETIVEKKFKFDKEKWYTILVELNEKEVCVQIPEAQITIYGESEGIAAEKDRFEFISGGDNAWFDDLKIWEATSNPKWAEIKKTIPSNPPKTAAKSQ